MYIAFFAISITFLSCGDSNQYSEPLPRTVDFNFHIRPILVQNCYLCHGPDPSSRKAELRLDTYEGATAKLKDGGYAIIPGKPSKSQLIYRVNHKEEDQIMPPPETNHKLTGREKALLEKWIDQGAEWKKHWAFITPIESKPNTENNNLDAWIDQRLIEKSLEKVPEANKNSLIRRASFLLTGLPPTPKKIEEFLSDDSEDAYEKLVDHYLNSPEFGERWARHWMDLVRYAETKGHEFDYTITGAWKYRDYLIRAFNDDLPYDQLVKEHLAGDLLKTQRYQKETGISESQLGTVFYTMGEGTHSPVDIKQDEADRIDNIIDVTTKTFQGLTVSCAKCHDHKFDPILAEDYYGLYGIMESTRFSPLSGEHSLNKIQTIKEIEGIEKYMQNIISDKWGKSVFQEAKKTSPKTEPTSLEYNVIGDFRNSDLDEWISNGVAFGGKSTLGKPALNRTGKLIGLEEGKASSKFYDTEIFGILRSKNFILDQNFIGVRAKGKESTIRIIIDNFQLIQNPIYGNLSKNINNNNWDNYVFDISPWKGHKAYIEIVPGGYGSHNYKLPKGAFVEAQYAIAYNDTWPNDIKNQNPETQISGINTLLRTGGLTSLFPELISSLDSIQLLTKKLKDSTFYYGVVDGIGVNSPIFNRGSYQEPSEDSIPRSFLSALPFGDKAFKSSGSGRLELADAIANNKNPLTSRVMVNRIWHHLFGRGLVETVDNFGLQGKLPSHPKLLDHLAVKFQNEGWSIKNIIRYIVTSETFKRTTQRDNLLIDQDPENIYLASFPIRRLEAEAIRDGMLAVTQSLDSTHFGPPVATYLTDFMQGRGRPKTSGPLDGNGRRSIYMEVRRNFLEPMMTTFDRPIPFSTFGKRNVSNVPSQSLIIMNDPFVAQQAEVLATKLLAQKDFSFEQKIEWIYMRTFSRLPSKTEVTKANEFIITLRQIKSDTELDDEVLIWKEFCHSLFNLKEFIYLI
ncbi:PSD1 and planctomycete cytochrome C domain-containing protein [Maribacter sp. HTCC2170]|uniref:PSD1 and planctomycete cytochrome C domain-containing protein n=1 Tax=Maribacter sp. (strain HTCC2170 / KCCM 42371) TaxID=313603 RepID=UPI001ED917D0|nr:PSD1 and planctomycete cytochrome C domain-containing protein [Maribacter sp. HTCC2170]